MESINWSGSWCRSKWTDLRYHYLPWRVWGVGLHFDGRGQRGKSHGRQVSIAPDGWLMFFTELLEWRDACLCVHMRVCMLPVSVRVLGMDGEKEAFNWAKGCSLSNTVSEWVKSLSRVRLFATLWTVAYQAPLSMGFSRQGYWSGLLFPSPGIFPTQGSNPGLPHCRQMLYCLSHQGSLK